jgi:anti-sigma-K factor RskA
MEIHELTAGYALDALDPAEREEYERHLPGCEQCREELASFWEVTSALAVAADGPAPRPELRERILESARAETQTVVPLAPRRRLTPVLAAAAGIAAVVAIGLGLYAASLHGQLGDTKSQLGAQQAIASVLGDADATTVAMQAGSGKLVVAGDGSAVLVLDDLSDAPAGKTYQAWVVQGTTPASAGTFSARDGRAVVALPQPVPAGAVVAVTVEPAGGATAPTLPAVAASQPA